MARHIIFSDSISINQIEDKVLDDWIVNTLKKNKENNNGVDLSNRGGYQTKSVLNAEINKIVGFHAGRCMKDFTDLDLKFEMLNMWINENYKYSYNMFHVHPCSHFSGIYYNKVPKNSGGLEFHRTDFRVFSDLYDYFKTPDTIPNFVVDPLPGMLIIFPATFAHSVGQSFSNESRISLAFNFNVKGHPK